MLKRLRLKNFRAFSDYSITFRERNVIVGRNNAGKSTVVEALRIVSIVVNRAPYLTFGPIAEDMGVDISEYGVKPSLNGTDIDLTHVCHQYSKPPAIIHAIFDSEEKIEAYLFNDNYVFAVMYLSDGLPVSTKAVARKFKERAVKTLPQVGPLQKEERLLKEKSVRQNLYTPLSPQHFRNQLYLMENYQDKFKELVERFWPGMRLEEISLRQGPGENPAVVVLVRDGPFVAEAAWMGHGLQVWLQVLWFLSRVQDGETIIIDEPDVYLHADLQRQMVRFIMNMKNQIILTTHSPEIISEVNPSEILIIDKTERGAKFANSLPSVQHVLETVGTFQNIYFLRIWSAKCMVFVEGEDLSILDKLHSKLDRYRNWSIGALPSMVIRGWGGWKYVTGADVLSSSDSALDIKRYCILDSDYHLQEEIEERYQDAEKHNVELHVWRAKEIENYLIVPSCIARVVSKRSKAFAPTTEDIEQIFFEASEKLRVETEDDFGAQLHNKFRNAGKDYKWCRKQARDIVEKNWGDFWARRNIVSGKDTLSEMSKICSERFGVSFGVGSVLENIRKKEIDTEIDRVIDRIGKLDRLRDLR